MIPNPKARREITPREIFLASLLDHGWELSHPRKLRLVPGEGREFVRIDERGATPQDLGSAVTYGRRYSLVTLFGLAPEDDDGEAAQKTYRKETPAAAPKRPVSAPEQDRVVQPPEYALKREKADAIRGWAKKFNLNQQQLWQLLGLRQDAAKMSDLTLDELQAAHDEMMAFINRREHNQLTDQDQAILAA